MLERIDPVAYDPARFYLDLQATCHSILAPFEGDKTRQVLEIFDDEFRHCVVQLKTTDKPAGGLYYRFFYKGAKDLTELARRSHLLGPHPNLQAEVLRRCAGATRAGLDFEASYGLAKQWTFCGGPTPVEQILTLPGLPASVRAHASLFREFGLRQVFFLAEDFQASTMNVYFGWEDECRQPEWIRGMVQASGGAAPTEAKIQAVLASQAMSGGVGMTFAWDQPQLLRWCVYCLEVPQPLDLPERLQIFSQAPTLNQEPQFNLAWSPGGSKLEKSYSRDATYFLTQEMGGDLRRRGLQNA